MNYMKVVRECLRNRMNGNHSDVVAAFESMTPFEAACVAAYMVNHTPSDDTPALLRFFERHVENHSVPLRPGESVWVWIQCGNCKIEDSQKMADFVERLRHVRSHQSIFAPGDRAAYLRVELAPFVHAGHAADIREKLPKGWKIVSRPDWVE